MKDILKNGVVLMLYAMVAAAVLGFVYVSTKDAIKNADLSAKFQAMKAVLTDYETGKLMVDEKLIKDELMNSGEEKVVERTYEGVNGKVILPYYEFNVNGKKIFVLVGAAPGFGGDVKVMASFVKENGKIFLHSIRVLDASQETPGLGAKIMEEGPQKRFSGIPQSGLEKGVVVDKDAKDRSVKNKSNGVVKTSDIMTGATITPRAVANSINIMYSYLKEAVLGGEK